MKKYVFALVLINFLGSNAYTQWVTTGAASSLFARTSPVGSGAAAIRSVGIGDFTGFGTTNSTLARFHVVDFGIGYPTNLSIPVGSLSRIDGVNTNTNYFSFCTGPNPGGSTEKFRLSIPANSDNAVLRTTLGGRMYLQTNALERVTIAHLAFGAVMDDAGFTNPVPGNQLGRVMITRDGLSPVTRPLALLHLGTDFPLLPQGGQRNWMDVGMICMTGTDHVYIGLRQQGATATGFPATMLAVPNDHQDGVLCWGDNSTDANGPDNMCFVYTSPPSFGSGRANSNDGLEVMRMIYNGNIGIGPIFNNAQQPQSILHTLTEGPTTTWHQISNQTAGVNAFDGLRMGVIGNANANINGHALLYNQENRPILLSTNANTNTVNGAIAFGTTQERVRIQSAGTPVYTFGFPGTYGISNPAGISPNFTRVGVSHNPNSPLWRPLTLMHIGYSAAVNTAGTVMDGWRPWMDIGTYTASPSDNIYVGLKQEGSNFYDGVIAWGRNQDSVVNAGPEHLRFIFNTNYNATPDNNPANNINGLETGRFYAGKDTLGTYGRFGVGDFTATGVNEDPTHKLDVVGNGRFRFLPDSIYMADASVTKVVMVDEDGVLRWDDAIENEGVFGYECGDTTDVTGLTNHRFLPMNDFNIHFDDNGSTANGNNVGIGTACADVLTAKLVVDNIAMNSGIDAFTSKPGVTSNWGIRATAQNATSVSTGVEGRAAVAGPTFNKGIRGLARNSAQTNMGGDFLADSPSTTNYGVNAVATGAISGNYGLIANGSGGSNAYGVHATATGGSSFSYGVYCSAPVSATNAAIYINGDIRGTGTDFYTSDANLKQNIQELENASEILSQLSPKTYEFNHSVHTAMHLPHGPQMGLIAQDVQAVLPNLVKQSIFPAQYDSLGNVISDQYNYLSLSYTGLIPILIAGHNEMQEEMEEKDSIIQSLNDRLTQLENCISSLNPCNTQKSATPPDNSHSTADHVSNVELKDVKSIILDQNVPNPFAEQTTITYTLTEDVQRAQMLFYNADGKLINSVELTERGKGQLNVFANDLSNGIYTYTLVVDEKIIDTKRMIKNQ